MYSTAAFTSSSLKSGLPPRAGMALKPEMACLYTVSLPAFRRGAHSSLWVMRGILGMADDAPWQAKQVLSKMALPAAASALGAASALPSALASALPSALGASPAAPASAVVFEPAAHIVAAAGETAAD